jgi:outer membrane protein OmpA-like peptidoglycan-associated protein
MPKAKYFPITLIAVAILAGCATPTNPSLTEAHSNYDRARSDAQVTSLAALELKEAGDTLNKADEALKKGEKTATVDHLAYLTNQQIAIAQETARRKTAELEVANAGAQRDQVRLAARTEEADAAKQQVATMQKTAEEQAEDLAAAQASAESDQAIIARQQLQLKELKAQKLNAEQTERGLVVTLGDVLFSTGKAQLASGGTRNVRKLADFLMQYPKRKALIEGYTDSTGSESFNQALSERRANAVKKVLIDAGISGNRLATRGYGEALPVASNDSAGGRQMNRRVEIILSDEKGDFAKR